MALWIAAGAEFFRSAAGWQFLASREGVSWLGRQTSAGGVTVRQQRVLLLRKGSLDRRLSWHPHLDAAVAVVVEVAAVAVVVVVGSFVICLM